MIIYCGTTANEGTRVSLVRMTPDVVYYSWADIDTKFSIPEYLKVSESIWILLKERTLTLDIKFFLRYLERIFFYVTWRGFSFTECCLELTVYRIPLRKMLNDILKGFLVCLVHWTGFFLYFYLQNAIHNSPYTLYH